MKKAWRISILSVFLSVAAMGGLAEAAKYTVFAVAVNGSSILGTTNVSVNPGDFIELEFWGSDWSPEGQRLKNWQIGVDCSGYSSGGAGELIPLGLDNPQFGPSGFCASDDDCEPPLVCFMAGQLCAGPDNDPTLGAFIDNPLVVDQGPPPDCSPYDCRLDYVYFNKPELAAVDTSLLCYRYGSLIFSNFDAPVFTVPRYFATLILTVSDDACGTFTVGPLASGSDMRDLNVVEILPLEVEPVTINVGAGCPCRLARDIGTGEVQATPANCMVDARQPEDPDGTNPAGFDAFSIRLESEGGCSGLGISDFIITELPEPSFPVFPNTITDVRVRGGNVTLTFRNKLTLGSWTCVEYRGDGGGKVCVGHLPGDVGSDGTSNAADVISQIDCLTNPGSCALHQCDADRSATCAVADLLRNIDLLNGGGSYAVWMGEFLGVNSPVPCPSAAP